MHDVNFVLREPLTGAGLRVHGYELSWQNADGSVSQPSELELQSLAGFVGKRFMHVARGYLMAGTSMFLGATPETLRSGVLDHLSPKDTVLTIQRSDLGDATALEDIHAARAAGFGVLLRDADLANGDKGLLPLISHIEVRFGDADFVAQVELLDRKSVV